MAPLGFFSLWLDPFSQTALASKMHLSELTGAQLVGMTHWMSGFFPKPNPSPPLNSWT